MNTVVIAAIGALAAILANRGIAVFNDGLRPIMPEYIEGRMTRAEIASTSFAMSFGLVMGFGIGFYRCGYSFNSQYTAGHRYYWNMGSQGALQGI